MPWQTVSYNVLRLASKPSAIAGGTCIVACGGPPLGQVWLITGCVVVAPTSETVACELFDQDPTQGNVLIPCAGTRTGNLDFGDWGSPVIIRGGDQLWVVWTGVDQGIICRVRVQYELAQSVGASSSGPILGS